MASGRPDFHPTMLLEGKHDTELIPVLVDANGQMYIVMTGQQIQINNLPSDYFKAGQAIGESAVGVVNLPSDYYKAGQAVGSVTANVNVAQTEKDRDMIGLDTATRRQIAVDAAGIILARLKGAYGATLKDIAVDDVGILLARMKGAYGAVLKDVAVDDVGAIVSRMKAAYGGVLHDVAIDATGKIIAAVQGWDGTNLQTLKIDAYGNIIARMKGYDGEDLRDVKVDTAGYMLAKMMGLEGANLRVVAVDANGIMKANLTTQDLDYLRVRPVYGQATYATINWTAVPHQVATTLMTINGRGAILGGYLFYEQGFAAPYQYWYLYIDGADFAWNTVGDLYVDGFINNLDYPLSISRYNPVDLFYRTQLGKNLTFESSFVIKAYQNSGASKNARVVLFYALVP